MKMDEKYFDTKIYELRCSDFHSVNVKKTFYQIARDAAEEQREKCVPYCEYKTKHGCVNCPEEMEIPE
jgi:hypothetical protein